MTDLLAAAEALVASVTFDDSGANGTGGNGGLISRETIRRADELRLALAAAKRSSSPLAGEDRGGGTA